MDKLESEQARFYNNFGNNHDYGRESTLGEYIIQLKSDTGELIDEQIILLREWNLEELMDDLYQIKMKYKKMEPK